MNDEPVIVHVETLDWHEVHAQRMGERRASVWNRFVDISDSRTVIYTRYDPGVVLARHWHASDEIILVLEGSLMAGDRDCPTGSVILLDAGTRFGPIVTGDAGAVIFEMFDGPAARAGTDHEGFDALLEARGVVELPDPPFRLPETRR
jgi:anti-sigma factor ChrR (cupin superfamily)